MHKYIIIEEERSEGGVFLFIFIFNLAFSLSPLADTGTISIRQGHPAVALRRIRVINVDKLWRFGVGVSFGNSWTHLIPETWVVDQNLSWSLDEIKHLLGIP